ncbi:hypothetical protein BBJ28_00020261 [Nothophytophthora sp. Chile5]|nr:hypothetical protein BBJ28_00020261 [Nothophytophthora sp. Chile5]
MKRKHPLEDARQSDEEAPDDEPDRREPKDKHQRIALDPAPGMASQVSDSSISQEFKKAGHPITNCVGFTAEIYTAEDAPVWDEVLTPRLKQAMNQLCGRDRWEDFGCGWWMITFPDQAESPWEAAGKWHVDGAAYQHHLDSKESGLLAVFLFSDIAPGEGGTALSVGSHKWIARLLEKNEPRGMKGGAVSFQARKFRRERVVEVNGKAGDVMLVHPFLLHARSKNLGQKGADSVRMMCNPNVRLHQKMNLNRPDGDYSPVEQAIVDALRKPPSHPDSE